MPTESSARSAPNAARTGVIATAVTAFAFFDGVFFGLPIAALAMSLQPVSVFVYTAIIVSCVSIVCSSWVNRRWDEWFVGNDSRVGKKLEKMRASRLMRRPVDWIESGSDGRYALAAALANPTLVVAFARSMGARPVGDRRILLGSVAYALPYVAVWTLLGFALGDVIRAAGAV
jgi:hypothetical protein